MNDATPMPPTWLTQPETIAYLRLDVDDRDAAERLRNLIRRQGLPVVRRGRLVLFNREALDIWLTNGRAKTSTPARLQATQRLTARTTARAQQARRD
jgi:excisionase family DNA binding protein